MQINLKKLLQGYTEAGQNNPLRYVCLHQVGENVFENTTNVFKCKDYFNDFVAARHGAPEFRIYGMTSSRGKFDQYGGMTLLLGGVTPNLEGNMRRVLEPFRKQWGVDYSFRWLNTGELNGALPALVGEKAVLWLSPECFVSTFRISMLMLFIRNCNFQKDFADYDSVFHRQLVVEGQWQPNYMDTIRNAKFDFDEQKVYWWWFNKANHSGVIPNTKLSADTIHNNGQANWLSNMIPYETHNIYEFHDSFQMPMDIDEMMDDADDEEELEFEGEEQ